MDIDCAGRQGCRKMAEMGACPQGTLSLMGETVSVKHLSAVIKVCTETVPQDSVDVSGS